MVASDADWSCARWCNTVVLVWRGTTNMERARRAMAVLRDAATEHASTGIASLVVVEPRAATPDSDTRPVFAAGMRECGSRLHGVAYVVAAKGFRGAAVRAAISGLSLLAREPYPTKVFTSTGDAAAWLAPTLGGIDDAHLMAAAEYVRRA